MNNSISILRKVKSKNELTMNTQISSRNPFGLATNVENYSEENTNSVKVYASIM